MGIFYKITCDRCDAEYPEGIDTEMHHGSFFGAHPDDAALEIREHEWLITMGNEVLCPACGADSGHDSEAEDDGDEERLAAAAFRLATGEVISGKTHVEAWGKMPPEYGRLPYKKMREEDAVEELINDCDIHHHIDSSMLSSDAGFYEFLFTEVKFHADSWGLDFTRARKVYEFWAKKKRRDFHAYED
jgi:hypothetical protein